MLHTSLFMQILRLVPAIPVALYHVLAELVQDVIKFWVRPEDVEWPEPSAAARL